MSTYLLIALGGALGSVARHWLSTTVFARSGSAFPWGTFWVNVSGCFLIGFFAALGASGGRFWANNDSRLFFMTGLCGGYTTFSAFSLQTLSLLRDGDWPRATAYVLASVLVCLLGVWLGQLAASLLSPAS